MNNITAEPIWNCLQGCFLRYFMKDKRCNSYSTDNYCCFF